MAALVSGNDIVDVIDHRGRSKAPAPPAFAPEQPDASTQLGGMLPRLGVHA